MNNEQATVPFIPENAPFTPAQRAWLNGFLAGMYCRTSASGAPVPGSTPAAAKPKLTILFGSQSGNAESLAKKTGKEAQKRGFEASVIPMEKATPATLTQEKCALIVTSTWGEGDPPDNAANFWNALRETTDVKLSSLRYAVLALGDENYPDFCGFGKKMDAKLAELGAQRVLDRVDCGSDFDDPAQHWLDEVFSRLEKQDPAITAPSASNGNGTAPVPALKPAKAEPEEKQASYSRKNPFLARLVTNRKLTAEGSAKDTRHFEISLKGSGLTYEVGDALGIIPTNDPELVQEILNALGFDGEEEVPGIEGEKIPIRLALLRHYQIRAPHKDFLTAMAAHDETDQYLRDLISGNVRTELDKFLWGREIIDFLLESRGVRFPPEQFVSLLKPLQPRLYSIASSLKAHPEQVHLTVDTVRYESYGRKRKGVCSNFLAERCGEDTPLPVFVQVSKHFRLPQDTSVPIIMVGPGTGIAPFRAFLHERRAVEAKGRNWLFFGAQKSASDFFYREELEGLQKDGYLSRLDKAFSRDQEHKIYVQNRMTEAATELWKWLEEGAHFYVCGDASRMARDVDSALHAVVCTAGGKSEDDAAEYVQKLKSDKRYQRDVY